MASSFSILRCSWDKRSMIMAALHTVNHNILSPTRYQLLRQIKSGSEGQDDVAQMLGILNEVEHRPVALGRVLDLGCASGRMLRFLPREETSEHWGLTSFAEPPEEQKHHAQHGKLLQ